MNYTEIFKKIGVIISELSEQHHYLADNPGSLNEFELELLRANAHFLNDHIDILQKLTLAGGKLPEQPQASAPVSVQEEPPAPKEWVFHNTQQPIEVPAEEKLPEPAQPAPEEEPVILHYLDAEPEPGEGEELPEDYIEPEEAEEPVAMVEDGPEEEPFGEEAIGEEAIEEEVPAKEEPIAEEEPAVKVHEEPAPEPIVTEVVIREKIVLVDAETVISSAKPVPTLNELLSASATPHTTLSGQLNRSSSDLKSAINLNDKLLFVKDLFNGYSLAYSEALELVSRSSSFDGAKKFLESTYAAKNNWAAKQATLDKFYSVISQKFG